MVIPELTDVFGVVANVGDKIAAGMSYGQSSVLRIGEIIGIKGKEDTRGNVRWSVRVRWTHNGHGSSYDVRESTILIHSNYSYAKIVVLPKGFAEQYPEDVKPL